MAELTLPRWIITNICMPHGYRTAPKPVLIVPPQERDLGYSTRYYSEKTKGYDPPVLKDIFEHWEYRFWCMAVWPPSTQILTECRCCGHLGEQDKTIRQQHFKQSGCSKRLCNAYSLLLRDMACVICDKKAHNAKWGVPLCSSACTQAWCESESQPKALLEALKLTEDQR